MTGKPKWASSTLGPTVLESIFERRSTLQNDNGVEDGETPPASYTNETYKGKFFTRGCRGKIEKIQVYCTGDGVDELEIRYTPYPCFGPFYNEHCHPTAGWAWQDIDLGEMWNYDSILIYVAEITANISYGYDEEATYDGHESDDEGQTWAKADIRVFFRVVYSGETPGDVPVSGIVNTIPTPSSSSRVQEEDKAIPADALTLVVAYGAAGHCDYIEARVAAATKSHLTYIRVYIDGNLAMDEQFMELSTYGHGADTPTVGLPVLNQDGLCCMLIHKRFEFRNRIQIYAYNATDAQTVTVAMHPTYMR